MFVSVLGLGTAGRAIASAQFGGRSDVGGGVIVWSPTVLERITSPD